ncbi:MAG: extracellular solute-binding protein [Pseudomonadota bacterium]
MTTSRGSVSGAWKRALSAALAVFLVSSAGQAEEEQRIRILSISDPFALVLSERLPAFSALVGAPLSVELTGYTELRRRILLNAFQPSSAFDLISIDMGWGREVYAGGLVLPLETLLQDAAADLETMLLSARAGATVDGQIVGLPVQPHAEVLFYDEEALKAAGLSPPETTEDVLRLGAALHEPGGAGRAGICWNAQRGAALGQTMLHLLAAFGGRPLDEAGGASLDTPELRAAIDYAVSLVPLSPPNILSMAWDERIEAFVAGRCAMTYGWTGRTLLMQRLGLDLGAGGIGVAAAPHAPGVPAVSPLGAWLFALPANLAEERRERALRAMLKLTSQEANRAYLAAGVGALLHTSLLTEREVGTRNLAFRLLGALESRGELVDWMRPNIPQFQALTEILGTEVYAVLLGQQDSATAAAASQAAFERLLAE